MTLATAGRPHVVVLVVEESNARHTLPAAQAEMLTSHTLADYCKAAGMDYKVCDLDAMQNEGVPAWQQTLGERREMLPWVIIRGGRHRYNGPLPDDTSETLKLLWQYSE